MNKKIVLVGAGGSGKDYAKKILVDLGLTEDISYTTRPPRTGEVGGKDYHFITENNMLKMITENEFIQSCYFPNGFVYGTHIKEFYNKELFIMTPDALEKLNDEIRSMCHVVYFNIDPEVRLERLSKRKNADNPNKRLRTDNEQFQDFIDFDAEIVDEKFDLDILIRSLPIEYQTKIISTNI